MTNSIRKLVKSLVWRISAFLVLTIVSFFVTRSVEAASTVAVFYTAIQVLLYYFHEKIWERIRWGKLKGVAVQFTGLSGAGKSTIAQALATRMRNDGYDIEIIDGDEYRENLCSDLGFSRNDRIENLRRLSFVAHKIAEHGKVAVIAAISPYEECRQFLKNYPTRRLIVHVDVPLDVVIERDTKGLYKRALLPAAHPDHVPLFTGVSDAFDIPNKPDVVVNTHEQSLDTCVSIIEKAIRAKMR